MYVRKYAQNEDPREVERVSIPENYAGNAFKHSDEPLPCPQKEAEEREESTPNGHREEKPCASKKMEMLPVLLSVLLSESKEHEDIATLLLFLLLL